MIIQTPAIVLKTFDIRETSRIAVFFSKDHGKVKGILKGIRKDPRKFGSSLEKFSLNDLVYYEYRNSDIHLVSHCDMTEYFPLIRQDLKKTTAAGYITELVDKIMPVEQPNGDVYTLMLDFFKSLPDSSDINKLVHIFQIKILAYSGFRPVLDACVRCRETLDEEARFSMRSGGLMCPQCSVSDTSLTQVSRGAIASILHIERSDWQQSLRLNLPAAIKSELKYILNNFLVLQMDQHIKASRYLA